MALDEGMQQAPSNSGAEIKADGLSDSKLGVGQRNPALAILTAQSGWITANNKERLSKAKHEAIATGRDHALVRDVRGTTGDQKPFAERKIQFLTTHDATVVRDFLSANPDLSEVLLKDPSAFLGEYPHTKPIDGNFTGWLAQKIEFGIVSIVSRKD